MHTRIVGRRAPRMAGGWSMASACCPCCPCCAAVPVMSI